MIVLERLIFYMSKLVYGPISNYKLVYGNIYIV